MGAVRRVREDCERGGRARDRDSRADECERWWGETRIEVEEGREAWALILWAEGVGKRGGEWSDGRRRGGRRWRMWVLEDGGKRMYRNGGCQVLGLAFYLIPRVSSRSVNYEEGFATSFEDVEVDMSLCQIAVLSNMLVIFQVIPRVHPFCLSKHTDLDVGMIRFERLQSSH